MLLLAYWIRATAFIWTPAYKGDISLNCILVSAFLDLSVPWQTPLPFSCLPAHPKNLSHNDVNEYSFQEQKANCSSLHIFFPCADFDFLFIYLIFCQLQNHFKINCFSLWSNLVFNSQQLIIINSLVQCLHWWVIQLGPQHISTEVSCTFQLDIWYEMICYANCSSAVNKDTLMSKRKILKLVCM